MPTSYDLTSAEREDVQAAVNRVMAAKLTIYNLNMQMEQAQKEREAAEASWGGIVGFLLRSHGMPGGALTPDLTRIEGAK